MGQKKFGYCAILGATNAGKSTILNSIMSEKVAITSRKVQTTRFAIRGILTRGSAQTVFVDTPGVFTAKGAFDRRMVSEAWTVMDDADAVLYVLDAAKGITPTFTRIVEKLRTLETPISLVLNKTDAVKKPELLLLTTKILAETGSLFKEIFMASATRNEGLDEAVEWVFAQMPAAEWEYKSSEKTDATMEERLAELTREQVYNFLHHELPYGITVKTEKIEFPDVYQTIITNNREHKSMILGAKGARIKQIGTKAREDMQSVLGRKKVNLFLQVEVDKAWKE